MRKESGDKTWLHNESRPFKKPSVRSMPSRVRILSSMCVSIYPPRIPTRSAALGIENGGVGRGRGRGPSTEREMTRRCSHCSHDGHNSRTCPDRGLMLFGVRLTGGTIRKSASMGNLPLASGSIRKSASMGNLLLASGSGGGASSPDGHEPAAAADGYASEDLGQGPSSSARERKKGVSFLLCGPSFSWMVRVVALVKIHLLLLNLSLQFALL